MRVLWLNDHRWLNLDHVAQVVQAHNHVVIALASGQTIDVWDEQEQGDLWSRLAEVTDEEETIRAAVYAASTGGEDGR